MITWTGFVGEMIKFVVTKLVGKRLDMSLDRKSWAARSFLNFYDAVADLEDILHEVIGSLEVACDRRKPVIFSKNLIRLAPDIDKTSKEFLRTLNATMYAVEIFDPKLALLLCDIHYLKWRHLTALSEVFQNAQFSILFTGLHPFKKLSFTSPTEQALAIDFEEYYRTMPEVQRNKFRNADSPDAHKKLVKFLVRNAVAKEIGPQDFEQALSLCKELQLHRAKLCEAHEALRAFIAGAFTLEDVLAGAKG